MSEHKPNCPCCGSTHDVVELNPNHPRFKELWHLVKHTGVKPDAAAISMGMVIDDFFVKEDSNESI